MTLAIVLVALACLAVGLAWLLRPMPPPPPAPDLAPDASAALHLCDPAGHLEHEIGWHRPAIPECYPYAGKLYRRRAAHADGWEYRR